MPFCAPKENNCAFCAVTPDAFRIVHEDEELIAFHDRAPACETHLLIIPRRHIDSVDHLTKSDIPLLDRMQSLARSLATKFGENEATGYKTGFHIPPFTSVRHLHMHVLIGQFKFGRAWKYRFAINWRSTDAMREMLLRT